MLYISQISEMKSYFISFNNEEGGGEAIVMGGGRWSKFKRWYSDKAKEAIFSELGLQNPRNKT